MKITLLGALGLVGMALLTARVYLVRRSFKERSSRLVLPNEVRP